ncbi:MAG: threonine/serine exporter family protein [Clostridium sp.]|nr:threonine/serine exporter family protein [Clostridium sp.]
MILATFYSFLASMGFAIIFNIRGKNIIIASIGGGLSWFIYLLVQNFHGSNTVSMFAGAFAVAVFSEIMARLLKSPVTTFVIVGIIPLVPGNGMYHIVYETISGHLTKATFWGVQTLLSAGAIAVAIVMVSSISKLIFYKKRTCPKA